MRQGRPRDHIEIACSVQVHRCRHGLSWSRRPEASLVDACRLRRVRICAETDNIAPAKPQCGDQLRAGEECQSEPEQRCAQRCGGRPPILRWRFAAHGRCRPAFGLDRVIGPGEKCRVQIAAVGDGNDPASFETSFRPFPPSVRREAPNGRRGRSSRKARKRSRGCCDLWWCGARQFEQGVNVPIVHSVAHANAHLNDACVARRHWWHSRLRDFPRRCRRSRQARPSRTPACPSPSGRSAAAP